MLPSVMHFFVFGLLGLWFSAHPALVPRHPFVRYLRVAVRAHAVIRMGPTGPCVRLLAATFHIDLAILVRNFISKQCSIT